MRIFTTGGIHACDLAEKGQILLDDLGQYLKANGLSIDDVKFLQTPCHSRFVLTAIAP